LTVNLICLETVDVEPIVRKATQSSNSKQHSILITRLVQQDEEENTTVDCEGTQLLHPGDHNEDNSEGGALHQDLEGTSTPTGHRDPQQV